MSDVISPYEPGIVTSALPGTGGAIGAEPEDFVVDELPLYPPSGSGEHWFVRVQKRLWTTPDMVQAVGRAAHVRERDIGYAGMKDKHGITSQWISLPASAAPPGEWQLPDGLVVLESARNDKKLRTGHQRGNHFCIRLHGVEASALEHAEAICTLLRTHGLPNYFGAQRFGRDGQNLPRALDWLARGAPLSGPRARFVKKLYPSVVQSEIFNRYLAARAALGLDHVLHGEVMRLDGRGSVFVVEDVTAEQPRLTAGAIHATGPIHGPRMKEAAGVPLELERAALGGLGLTDDALALLHRLVDGTRRDLLVRPDGLSARAAGDGALELDFSLPSGSYATQLVRELTRAPWLDPRDSPGGAA